MKILTVIGARPQFIKAAAVSPVLRRDCEEILLHTGQHYDRGMSDIFFTELQIPRPDITLGVGSGSHGEQTAAMLTGIEAAILERKPDWLLIYGDTNSTLAGALAASKLRVPIAHIEAGLRSFNRRMPEEINRIVADQLSELLFCPSASACRHLKNEGITNGVHLTGDVMGDIVAFAKEKASHNSVVLRDWDLTAREYALATVHRAENTDDPGRLQGIFEALEKSPVPVVLPLHPRTRARVRGLDFPNIRIEEPVGYFDMVELAQNARLILTDSGGLQKEAFWLGTPCVTLRDETEWVETVESGWNRLAGADAASIADAIGEAMKIQPLPGGQLPPPAAERIVSILTSPGVALRPAAAGAKGIVPGSASN